MNTMFHWFRIGMVIIYTLVATGGQGSFSFSEQALQEIKNSKHFKLLGEEKIIIKFLLADYLENASIDLKRVQKKYEIIKEKVENISMEFTSLEAFYEYERSQWPESGDLITDINRIMNNGIKIIKPIFKDEINSKLWQENEKNKIDFLQKTGWQMAMAGIAIGQGNANIQKLNLNNSIQEFESHIVESLRGIFSGNGDSFVKEAFPLLISEYFQSSPARMKFNMLAGLLDETFPFSKETIIHSFFSNSGPNLQKMVQLLGRDKSIDENWKEFFQSFESEIRQVPFWRVEELLKKAKFPFEIMEIEKEPLGVGSVAQTHLGKVRLANGDIVERVFRFIKPGTLELAKLEREVIIKATKIVDEHPQLQNKNFPKLAKMADNVYTMLIGDMNLKEGAIKQRTGMEVYTRADIHVPEVWLSLEEEPLFMIQTKAEGKKLSKYSLYVRKKVINRIIQFWLEEALYGSGYFHADLHQGNFLIKLRKKFRGNERELKSILDYGMFGKLNRDEKTQLIALGIALKAKNVKAITNIAWALSNPKESEISKSELIVKISDRYKNPNENEEMSIESMLKYFSQIKLELNQNVLEFLRGSVALSAQLKEVDNKNSFVSNAIKVGLRHPIMSLKIFKLKEITLKDIFKVARDEWFTPKKARQHKVANQCLKYY